MFVGIGYLLTYMNSSKGQQLYLDVISNGMLPACSHCGATDTPTLETWISELIGTAVISPSVSLWMGC